MNNLIDSSSISHDLKQKIKLFYSSSKACLEINKTLTNSIDIKRSIKQGSSMSMLLYVLDHDLIERINKNENIRGFEFIVKKNNIKILAYADDTVLVLKDKKSIAWVIREFEEWGHFLGAKLNKNKSAILILNPTTHDTIISDIQIVKKVKILGFLFDQRGLADENIFKAINCLIQTCKLWCIYKFEMIERIIILKTFILSKFWHFCSICSFSTKQLKKNRKYYF